MDEFGKGLLIGCVAGAAIVILIMISNCGIGEGGCQWVRASLCCTVPLKIQASIPYH